MSYYVVFVAAEGTVRGTKVMTTLNNQIHCSLTALTHSYYSSFRFATFLLVMLKHCSLAKNLIRTTT